MKLLVIINSLELGGAERLVYDQLRVGRSRWQARVVCLDSSGPLADAVQALGIPVTLLGYRFRWDVRIIGRLRQIFSTWKPDVVHLHLPRSGFFGRLASIGFSHKLVYTEHNTWDIYPFLSRQMNAVTYHLNDQVVAVSDAVASFVQRRRWWSRNGKPQVVPNGVDVDGLKQKALRPALARQQLGLAPDDLVVGNVANLFLRKGQKYLLAAAQHVLRDVPRARFVLIGAGDQDGALKSQAKELGITDRVVFAGPLREAFRLMPAFDVFCLSSLYEGMPVSLLEAMAQGVPAVATAVGGNPEVITDGRTGYVVPVEDPLALANALTRLLCHEELRYSMGAAARQSVEQFFSIQNFINSYDRVYQKVN